MTQMTGSGRVDALGSAPPAAPATGDGVIAFPDGLPGFEACRRFVLIASPELEPLRQLRAVSGPDASFIGIDPKRVLPGYRCELNEFDLDRLGATADSVLLWLALIAIDADGTATANLRAPVVINPDTMIGYQVLPHRCLYALRHVITGIE
jgi:flagellar assembly factor FliW